MKSFISKGWSGIRSFIKNSPWLTGVIALALVGGSIYAFGNNSNDGIETGTLTEQSFIRTVSVAGKVIASQEVELGFEMSGRVAAVYKKVGDRVVSGETIAVLSAGDISADIAKAEADVSAEVARLNELKAGSKASNSTELKVREIELKQAARDAYTRSDDAVRNSVDQFYDDKGNIVFAFDDNDLRNELNEDRDDVEILLMKWEEKKDDEDVARENLRRIQDFLAKVASAVNEFTEDGGPYTQSQIDKFRSDISNARTNINNAISNLTTAEDAVRSVESEIPYQQAKVDAAKATVSGLKAELGKKAIVAPFSGVVTVQDAKVGNSVSGGDAVTTLISASAFQIETFVPEINISEISVGNTASVTLDAYGEEKFEARVVAIDPAETVRDGVSTYKVTFEFNQNDKRLKPGLTANVAITTEEKQASLLVPQDALIQRAGFTYVQVKVSDEIVEKQITTGSVASTGEIEVISGLNAGEVVVLHPEVTE